MRRPAAALVALLAACSGPTQAPDAVVLEVFQAPPALAVPAATIDTIAVRVVTATRGFAAPGVRVEWSGDGTFEPLDEFTDNRGIARARWTLPQSTEQPLPWAPIGPSGTFRAHASVLGAESVTMATEAKAFTVQQVDRTGCGIRLGELWCWSTRNVGPPYRPVRFETGAPTPLREVRGGGTMTCVLDRDRLPWCARGRDAYQRVTAAPALAYLRAPNAGYFGGFFCGVATADQRAWCWPQDGSSPPTATVPLDAAVTQVDVGGGHACALKPDATTWCWGSNTFGQLGDGTNVSSVLPVQVAGGHAFTQVAVGGWESCGMEADFSIWCWGRGVQVIGATPVRMTAGSAHGPGTMVIGDDGDGYVLQGNAVRAWWRDQVLELESGYRVAPVVELSADYFACIRTVTEEVFCSWSMFKTVTTTRIIPDELVPVPDPASAPN